MSISLNLDDDQSKRLEERARELGVDPRKLALAAVNDLLARPADDFQRAAATVRNKNRELYRRLGLCVILRYQKFLNCIGWSSK